MEYLDFLSLYDMLRHAPLEYEKNPNTSFSRPHFQLNWVRENSYMKQHNNIPLTHALPKLFKTISSLMYCCNITVMRAL